MNATRRKFMQLGLGLAGSLAPAWGARADGSKPRAKSCILLYMDGGPSHIDMFDMKPKASADIRGPYGQIATSVPGIQICEHLPLLAKQMHHVLQIRSVRHEQTVHDPAVYQMLTGYKHLSSAGGLKVEETDLPHMGSSFAAADQTRSVLPKFIQTPDRMKMEGRILPGQNAGILPFSYDPFPVEITHDGKIVKPNLARSADESPDRLTSRMQLLHDFNYDPRSFSTLVNAQRLDRFRDQALAIMNEPAAQRAFDLERESPATHDKYGRFRQGQCVLLARRLVEAGCRFVTVYWGNEDQDWADGKGPRPANNPWDTHRNHFPLCKNSLFPRADQTLSALLDDLHQRGLLDETLVVWMGDFGRTPFISKPWASRDHWPHAFTVLMAGAGIQGGSVFGKTDKYAAQVEEKPVSPADLTATIFSLLGSSNSSVATKGQTNHPLSAGRVIAEI